MPRRVEEENEDGKVRKWKWVMTALVDSAELCDLSPTMSTFYPVRSASFVITLFGTITNFALAVQVLAAWRSLKWEPESEWEASSDAWRIDGVKVIWALLSTYFASAATVCAVGLAGIVKSKPSLVRFYRDYSIADFSFCTFFTALTAYAAFHTSARAYVCEELTHHPELMHGMPEMGLNLENCERWLEQAVLAFVALMAVIIFLRLHFLLAVSNFYSQLVRNQHTVPNHPHSRSRHSDSTLQRIYLLPRSSSADADSGVQLVYAPIPLDSLPKSVRETAAEAWVTPSSSRPEPSRHSRSSSESVCSTSCDQTRQDQDIRPHRHRHSHSHGHHHRHSRSSSAVRTGTICLPISPDEGLLPCYNETSIKV